MPLDSGLATPGGELADPFEEFNSVTLHHEGDEHHGHQFVMDEIDENAATELESR